jgi:hypothetical protein
MVLVLLQREFDQSLAVRPISCGVGHDCVTL